MSNQSHPLAWSQNGDPIDLPENAAMWRVRRLNGGTKGGAPEIVYGPDGLPLVVPLDVMPDDFAESVERKGGKYRLDAIDETRRTIANVPPAYIVVGGSLGREPSPMDDDTGAIERVVKTLAETMRSQSAQIGALVDACARLVNAVDIAGVSKRELPPAAGTQLVPVAAAPTEIVHVAPAADPPWYQPFIVKFAEMTPQLIPLAIQAFGPSFGFGAAPAAPSTPSAQPSPAPAGDEPSGDAS